MRLGNAAVQAFRELEKRAGKDIAAAIDLGVEKAGKLADEHRAAGRRLGRVQSEACIKLKPPSVREISNILLIIAKGDLKASAARVRKLPQGCTRWRATYVYWQALISRNQQVLKDTDGGTKRGLAELNLYRMALGHTPLLMNEKLMRAAAGHSEEMGRLGYFSHDSPVPARRTEWDRAKLEGYTSSVSENIFKSSALPRALLAWKQSARHHRTMTLPGNREAGIGVAGPCTMVFGAGERNTPPRLQY